MEIARDPMGSLAWSSQAFRKKCFWLEIGSHQGKGLYRLKQLALKVSCVAVCTALLHTDFAKKRNKAHVKPPSPSFLLKLHVYIGQVI